MELTMDNIGNIHGVTQASDLMNSSHNRQASHRSLSSHGRPAMVSSMASILEGGEYRADHSLSGPLHPAMSMSCESPPGMSLSSTYTTLTPLQHLPPISTVSDKFHHPHHHHHHHHHHHPHQRLAGNVSGSFTLMRDERGLPSMGNLYSPYHKDMATMGQPLSPLSNGLGTLHNSQQSLAPYGGHMGNEKMMSPNGFDSHAAMLSRGDEHLGRGLAGPGAGMMAHLNGMHHHTHHHGQTNGSMLSSDRDRQASVSGPQGNTSNQVEEINTKEVAQRITAELKRYSIPQAIFAQRILCRSQGTLSDLLRNPKPWSKLKSGRETFRRMWKWLQEPEFQRMSALRLAAGRVGRQDLKSSTVETKGNICVGRITQNDESEYRMEMENLVAWYQNANLALNSNKTKEIIVDVGKGDQGTMHAPVQIGGMAVEKMFNISSNQADGEVDLESHRSNSGKHDTGHEQRKRSWSDLTGQAASVERNACKRKEQEQNRDRATTPKKQRLVFTDLQRRTLIAIFKENKRPSKEMQITISQQLGLELNTVSNFFMNARRRSMDRWLDEPSGASVPSASATSTFTKA